jgi:hypothetical protein
MKLAAYIVSILLMISLAMDWNNIYFYTSLNEPAMPVFLNKGFITGIVSVIAIVINILLLRKDEDYLYNKNLGSKLFSGFFMVLFIITLYIVFLLEIGYQVNVSYENYGLSYVALACYNYFYLMAVIIWVSHKKIKFLIHGLTAIAIFGLMIFIFVVAPHYKTIMAAYLVGNTHSAFTFLHFFTGATVLTICFYLWKNVKDIYNANTIFKNFATWFSIIIGIVVLSFELDYAVLHINRPEFNIMDDLLRENHLIGWPILWGIIAFTLMFTGIRINDKNLRIIGISIFFFALLKFFIVDVWDMPAGGRIIAGASLAVLLLVISFLYQKLKRIILEDVKEPVDSNQKEPE